MEHKLTKEQARVVIILNGGIVQAKQNLEQANLDFSSHTELLKNYLGYKSEANVQFRAEGQEIIMIIEDTDPKKGAVNDETNH